MKITIKAAGLEFTCTFDRDAFIATEYSEEERNDVTDDDILDLVAQSLECSADWYIED